MSPEQKEHMREHGRAHAMLSNTWQLFMQFLSENKKPEEALQLAQQAMEVWKEYEDSQWIEPPEIEEPNFVDQFSKAMEKGTEFYRSIQQTPQYIPVLRAVPVEPQQPPTPTPTAPTNAEAQADQNQPNKE